MESKRPPRVDKFTFEYISNIDTSGKYGKYIYRNIYTNKLLASHESPFSETSITVHSPQKLTVRQQFFTPDEVGLSTDAIYLPF